MTCIRPAGRRGVCSCGNQYAQILDRLDTVEQEASDAKTTAQTAANTASIQAANAAADAAQAASDAGDALTQATAAAASAAAAALDAADAAADLASINSTISSTLTTYLGTKVDKAGTTGTFAYTHTNATQTETALVDGTTGNTIPIRAANGRLQAADPASGATDKTLTTANWVSQTGDSAPNNLLHRSGNETKTGTLQLNGVISRGCTADDMLTTPTSTVSATVMTLIDQMNGATHNSLGAIAKVRNATGQNYIDINTISYGYVDSSNVQWRIDLFLRLLIDETTGNAALNLYRQKRRADGTGTVATKVYTIQSITFSE